MRKAYVTDIRRTSDNKLAGSVRLLLAVIFLMTGAMKLLVPSLAEAWSGQLQAANIPLYTVSRWGVPFLEIALGAVLAVGVFTRPAAVVMMGIMAVATYVHLVVDDPALFPLQPTEPIIPLIVIVMGVYILLRGAGSWSLDLRATRARP
jgi:putative oxidoreductase